MNRNNFLTKYNNATTGLFRAGQSRGIGSDDMRVLITDIVQNVSWDYGNGSFYNVKDYGVTGDGVTDEQTILQDLIDVVSAGSVIFFPMGTYVLESPVVVDKVLTFVGSGATIKLTEDSEGFTVEVANCNFKGLKFTGTGKDAGDTNQFGIHFDNAGQFIVTECEFTTLSGAGIMYNDTGTSGNLGGSIGPCRFYDNNFAIDTSTDGEYVLIGICNIANNNTGCRFIGGNNIVAVSDIIYNINGIDIAAGSNNGHGIISNCNINHQGDWAVRIFDTVNGYTISNCHIYDGDIHLKNCNGVVFQGGTLDVGAYYFENSTATVFKDIKFDDSYVSAINNNYNTTTSETVWIDCMHIDGRYAYDALRFSKDRPSFSPRIVAQTSNNTTTTAISLPIPDNSAGSFKVHVIAKNTSNNDVYVGEKILVVTKDGAGTGAVVGAVADLFTSIASGGFAPSFTLDEDSDNFRVRITGIAATTIDWDIKVTSQIV
jgi:hypothetical protein